MEIDINEDIITIDTNDLNSKSIGEINSLIERTGDIYNKLYQETEKVTISLLAFNKVEKTKTCIESLIKYTSHIDYRLILMDNGSEDEDILGLYKSIEHPKKTIIQVTKNLGSNFGHGLLLKTFNTRFLMVMPNDVLATHNWLDNLLTCIESDDKIGWVTACTSNSSNFQDPLISFDSIDEMQEKAKEFNVSNPQKWEERLRLICLAPIIRKEVVDCLGGFDFGYFHDFAEDDYCRRLRSLGYKIIVAKDTFLHHDHYYSELDSTKAANLDKSLELGRKNYLDKFYIDAWDSTINSEVNFIQMLETQVNETIDSNLIPNILGINVNAGTPILDIRNYLRRKNIFNSNSYATTNDANYYNDLIFATENEDNVKCGNINNIINYYEDNFFDYILIGTPINKIENCFIFLESVFKKAKKGCKISLTFEDPYNAMAVLQVLGYNLIDKYKSKYKSTKTTSIDIDCFSQMLNRYSLTQINRIGVYIDGYEKLAEVMEKHLGSEVDLFKMNVRSYSFCIVV